MFKEHVETLHGIARLIVVRVAPFRRSQGIFSSTAFVDAATSCRRSKTWCGLSSICPKLISRASQSFGSPMLLLTVEGPKAPLSRGLSGFVALRCYAEECDISPSTQAQGSAWNLAECKRVEAAHCPTGATSGGAGCERNLLLAFRPLCLRTRLDLPFA